MTNSELEAALLAEAPKQWKRFQQNKAKQMKGKAKWQRQIEDAKEESEKIRRTFDPELSRIEASFMRKIGAPAGLRCSKCGEPNRGNKMNGKPWCFRCNAPMNSADKAEKQFPVVRVLPKSKRLDVTFQKGDDGT